MARAAGGRMENSIDCPMPMHTRQTKSRARARCGASGAVNRCPAGEPLPDIPPRRVILGRARHPADLALDHGPLQAGSMVPAAPVPAAVFYLHAGHDDPVPAIVERAVADETPIATDAVNAVAPVCLGR